MPTMLLPGASLGHQDAEQRSCRDTDMDFHPTGFSIFLEHSKNSPRMYSLHFDSELWPAWKRTGFLKTKRSCFFKKISSSHDLKADRDFS